MYKAHVSVPDLSTAYMSVFFSLVLLVSQINLISFDLIDEHSLLNVCIKEGFASLIRRI